MSDDPTSVDRLLEQSAAEQARLSAELEELYERTRRAGEAQQLTEGRMRATFVDLTDAARAELESIEAAHSAAVAEVRAEADAEARSILAEAGAGAFALVADDDPPDGP